MNCSSELIWFLLPLSWNKCHEKSWKEDDWEGGWFERERRRMITGNFNVLTSLTSGWSLTFLIPINLMVSWQSYSSGPWLFRREGSGRPKFPDAISSCVCNRDLTMTEKIQDWNLIITTVRNTIFGSQTWSIILSQNHNEFKKKDFPMPGGWIGEGGWLSFYWFQT